MPRTFLLNMLDDRGKPLPSVPRDQMAQFVWHDRTQPRLYRDYQRLGYFVAALVLVCVTFGFATDPASLTRPRYVVAIAYVGLMTAWPFVSRALERRRERRRISPPLRPHAPLVALLAAHRDCGACGYSLRETGIDPDGCTVCPECGAAWHRDRWTLEHVDIHSGDLLVSTVVGERGPGPMHTDDRGVPLHAKFTTHSAWLATGHAPPELVAHLTRMYRALRWRRVRIGVTVAGALWVIVNTLSFIGGDPRDRDIHVPLVGVVTALMGATLVGVAWRLRILAVLCRDVIALHRVCANCRYDLAHDRSPKPSFDACATCPRCGRAWRLPPPAGVPS